MVNEKKLSTSFVLFGPLHLFSSPPMTGCPASKIVITTVAMMRMFPILFFFPLQMFVFIIPHCVKESAFLPNGRNAEQLVLMMCRTSQHDSNYCNIVGPSCVWKQWQCRKHQHTQYTTIWAVCSWCQSPAASIFSHMI